MILPFETNAVEKLQQAITLQEEDSLAGAHESVAHAFYFAMYSMEISRLKFLLNAYIRTRLSKVSAS